MGLTVLLIISLWKIFTKLGKDGWISIVPFYNMWVLFETQGIQGWFSLIPMVNVIFMYVAYYRLAINFGKGSGFAVLTIFFPYICLPIMAFGKTQVSVSKPQVDQTQYFNQVINQQPVNDLNNNNQYMNQSFNQNQSQNMVYQQPMSQPIVDNSQVVNQNYGNQQNMVYQQPVSQPIVDNSQIVNQNYSNPQNEVSQQSMNQTQQGVCCTNCGTFNAPGASVCSCCCNPLK